MHRNLNEVFNQRDPERRATAIAEVYRADPVFYEQDGVIEGRDAPYLAPRASRCAPVVAGTDVAITSDGRIHTLYTFIEEPPA